MDGKRLILFSVAFLVCSPSLLFAHEPIFGLGPHTLFQGGYGIQTKYSTESLAGRKRGVKLEEEIAYGITPDLALTTSLPLDLQERGGVEQVGGRVKFRFFRKDLPGAQVAVAAVSGVVVPTRSEGSTGYLLGLNAGYEGRLWYGFLDGHTLLKSGGSGDALFLNGAVGARPFDTGYRSADWVFYLELNYEETGIGSGNARRAFFLSPTFFITYRNAALRGGYQFPVSQKVVGTTPSVQGRFALALEVHY